MDLDQVGRRILLVEQKKDHQGINTKCAQRCVILCGENDGISAGRFVFAKKEVETVGGQGRAGRGRTIESFLLLRMDEYFIDITGSMYLDTVDFEKVQANDVL
jgi:hypothetical protein